MRAWTPGGGLAGLVILAGCGLVPNDPPLADGPQSGTECSAPFAFAGEATIAGLDLVDAIPAISERDATRRGTIQISKDAVRWEEFGPPNVPPAVEAGQLLCVTWDDGGGLVTLLNRPFAGNVGDAVRGTEPLDLSATPIFATLAVLLVAVASWLAFRRGVRSGDG